MHIPTMISDLAIMLLTAGIVSVVFKKLRLPLIIGYIAVGFLISPYFPLFFKVESLNSITTWSEIGVIIILFHIGLEFDFHKLVKIGSTAIITAIVKMSGVMLVGYGFGSIIGLSPMNCIFLGAMLSISSTVIIKRSFDELGVRSEKYTSLVMGTLIMEDVLSIFIMVILSSIALGQKTGGGELVGNLALMGCYLIIWLLLGIFLLPTILNKIMNLMTDEMVTVLSLGICFGMALIARKLGFSVELGAFLAGSLFAGTIHAERVEKATRGIKDMFGAVFFLSVGMMVDTKVIVDNWTSIIPIALIAVGAKLVFTMIGMILSGQSLETAVKSGFSLAPIGEFSFIIASLGISLGVMDSYLYPVIVAASIITILCTPSLIRHSNTVCDFLNKHLPEKWKIKMSQYTSDEHIEEEQNQDWMTHIKGFFSRLLIYGVIMLVTAVAGVRLLAPALLSIMPNIWANIFTCMVVYLVMAIFLKPLLNLHNTSFTHLWLASRSNRPPLVMLVVIKVIVVIAIAMIPIHQLFSVHHMYILVFAVIAIIIVGKTDVVSTSYIQMETRFLRNLNEKLIHKEEAEHGKQEWLDEDINIISFFVPLDAPYIGKPLNQLNWGKNHNVYVVKMHLNHNGKYLLLPGGRTKVHAGDKIYAVGDRQSLLNYYKLIGVEPRRKMRTLEEFMETDYADTEHALACGVIKMSGDEPYSGQPIMSSKMLEKWHCVVLGIQKDGYPVVMPDPHMIIRKDDIIWVMGSNNNVGRLAALSISEETE
jgi:CPA2 family monovalent cation:H+ antiporter-2